MRPEPVSVVVVVYCSSLASAFVFHSPTAHTVVGADEGLPAKDVEAMRGFRCHRIHVPKRICEIGPAHAPVVARRGATVVWSDLARPHFRLRQPDPLRLRWCTPAHGSRRRSSPSCPGR